MADILSDQEFIEAMELVENIPHRKVAEDLDRLAQREKQLLISLNPEGEDREIILYNFTILVAAAARMKIMAKALESPDSE